LAELPDVPPVVEELRALDVAERVAGGDLVFGVVTPLVRVTDAHFQDGQLRLGPDLGLRSHPGKVVDPAPERRDLIAYHLFGPRLLLGREVARRVEPADRFSQRLVRGVHCALPAVAQLLRA
jgi:hypothetical protein